MTLRFQIICDKCGEQAVVPIDAFSGRGGFTLLEEDGFVSDESWQSLPNGWRGKAAEVFCPICAEDAK
jgi:hypothetical protein